VSKTDEVDVIVIGSGAGGAPVALTLREAGASVVVLEKGPYYTLSDFVHDEVSIVRRDFWVPWVEDDPHTLRDNPKQRATPTRDGWTSQCVGGATVHMSGFFYRMKPEDLSLATLTGGIAGSTVADWPITLEELLPYYDVMESRIGVSGQDGINPYEHRLKPFPLPALRAHPAAKLVDEAAKSLGLHSFPSPRAIASTNVGSRPPCNLCGFCGDYGCENHSKSSTLATLLPRAERTGHCEIRAKCMVNRIGTDDRGRARFVEYLDADGRLQRLNGRAIVLAASAIESARLLLLSQSNTFPGGLGNGSGLVGRNLTFSTLGKGTGVFSRDAVMMKVGHSGMELPFLQRSIQDDYWNPELGFPKGGTYNFILSHPNPIYGALRLVERSNFSLWGEALKTRLKSYFHDELWLEFEVFGEFLPTPGCFVDLDSQTRDRWGHPVARINLAHHAASDRNSSKMVDRGLEVLRAIEPAALDIYATARAGTTYHLQHGTCRFGHDPATSVLDPSCQSHEVPNLYVTDGSFMPTSGGVPATATILANSFRVADLIKARFLRREL